MIASERFNANLNIDQYNKLILPSALKTEGIMPVLRFIHCDADKVVKEFDYFARKVRRLKEDRDRDIQKVDDKNTGRVRITSASLIEKKQKIYQTFDKKYLELQGNSPLCEILKVAYYLNFVELLNELRPRISEIVPDFDYGPMEKFAVSMQNIAPYYMTKNETVPKATFQLPV